MITKVLLLLLVTLTPFPAQKTCKSGDKSIAIHVTAEFFQRTLSRSPRSQKIFASSKEAIFALKNYYKSLSKPDTGNQAEDASTTGSYDRFSTTVSADVSKVFSAVSSYTDDMDSSEAFRHIESSEEEEYQAQGYQQIVRNLVYTVTIDGTTASLEEEIIYTSIQSERSLNYFELMSLGNKHISNRYREAGGDISADSFTQSRCYKPLTTEETNALGTLEKKVKTLDAELRVLKENQTAQSVQIISLTDELRAQKRTTTAQADELVSLKGNLTDELRSQERTITAQVDELASQQNKLTALKGELIFLNDNQTAQDTQLTFMKQNQSTQAVELTAQKRSVTAQNIQITSQNNKIIALENKQTRIVKTPTGSLRSEACLVTCVGSTGAGSTTWTSYSSGYQVYTTVDMTDCGFLYTPIISASVEGTRSTHRHMTAAVGNAARNSFTVYMDGWVTTTRYPTGPGWGTPSSRAASYNWNVNWYATGYIC